MLNVLTATLPVQKRDQQLKFCKVYLHEESGRMLCKRRLDKLVYLLQSGKQTHTLTHTHLLQLTLYTRSCVVYVHGL